MSAIACCHGFASSSARFAPSALYDDMHDFSRELAKSLRSWRGENSTDGDDQKDPGDLEKGPNSAGGQLTPPQGSFVQVCQSGRNMVIVFGTIDLPIFVASYGCIP